MIFIQDKIVSKQIFEKEFVCNLKKCKGACCVEGEGGAPLEKRSGFPKHKGTERSGLGTE